MNDKEKKVLRIIRQNPYISQKDIASRMNLSRPSVANIISGLQQKGYILGKPYVLRETSYITCIGGANMDVTLKLNEKIVSYTSNPVKASTSYGGVIRNVAENLSKMHLNVSLMSLLAQDSYGDDIVSMSKDMMETFATEQLKNETTGTYYAIIDQKGEMVYGFASMDINAHMNRNWILRHKKHLMMSEYMISDLNVSKEGIEALLELRKELNIPLAIIGVSGPKMSHLPYDLRDLDVLICNVDESQTYFKTTMNDPYKLCQMWLEKGIKKTVITQGKQGVYYGEKDVIQHQKSMPVDKASIVDVTGAGDAFSSAFMYGLIYDYTYEDAVKLGTIHAGLTIQQPHAVNPNVSIKRILKELKHDGNNT